MDGREWLEEMKTLYRQYKFQCEQAVKQVDEDKFFVTIGEGQHSVATLMKHIGGNNRSRWRDFLTSDGEKRDRNRDGEFTTDGDTRDSIQSTWDEGWRIAMNTLSSLQPVDLERTITIRGQPLLVPQAIIRNLNHVAYHTGQIVMVARHFVGDAWETLSIAPGQSEEFNESMRARFGDWWSAERRRKDRRESE